MAKQRLIRDERPLAGDAEVLRAHRLDEWLLRENATADFELYGFHAVSVFSPAGDWTDLGSMNLRVLPTGAQPHGDVVALVTTGLSDGDPGDLNALVAAVLETRHHVEDYPHHRGPEEPSWSSSICPPT